MEGKTSCDWLKAKVVEIQKAQDTVAVIVISEAELKEMASVIGPWAAGEDFLADLKLTSTCWFYHAETGKRCLVVLNSNTDEAGAVKTMRGLGQKAAAALQTKKTPVAHFFIGTAIASGAAHFESSFHAANYEKTHRIESAQPKKDDADKADPRSLRLTKNVENYGVFLEDQSGRDAEAYKLELAMALALETSKSLVQVRGGIADPEWMAGEAQKIADGGGDLIKEVRILVDQELVAQGMNLFYNVGKGAVSKPRGVFIHYVGRPAEADQVDLAIVGKGVTYDTGGLNVKPTGGMELMYGDKGGACAVLGALKGCLDLKVKKNVVFACGFAENAIGADCYKPSDILRAMNGLSVEIGNTDAEGRLVMADTMTYVQRNFKPKRVAYIATLTGACALALGKTTAGLFSTDDAMVESWKKAAENSHEPLWHLPLNDEHRTAIKGQYGADIANMGAYRWGGASQAAAFLENFVEDKRPWAHLDIAGPGVFGQHDQSGFGAKLLVNFIYNHA